MRGLAPVQAIAAAALFGASIPLAKWLGLGERPLVGTALLYGGAGLGLAGVLLIGRLRGARTPEGALSRKDIPLLGGVVVLGGLLGPILQLYGLARTDGATASLLLNLEAVLTVAVAVAAMGEHLSRREAAGAALVVAGAVWLSVGSAAGG